MTTVFSILISIITQAPQVVESVKTIWDMLNQKEAATPEEQAEFDAACAAAHKAAQDL